MKDLWWDLQDLKDSIDPLGSPLAVLAGLGLGGVATIFSGLKALAGNWLLAGVAGTVLGAALLTLAANEAVIALVVGQINDLQNIIQEDQSTSTPFNMTGLTDTIRLVSIEIVAAAAINFVVALGSAAAYIAEVVTPGAEEATLETFGVTLGSFVNMAVDASAIGSVHDFETKVNASLCPTCTW